MTYDAGARRASSFKNRFLDYQDFFPADKYGLKNGQIKSQKWCYLAIAF
jgi:hypothetical protein